MEEKHSDSWAHHSTSGLPPFLSHHRSSHSDQQSEDKMRNVIIFAILFLTGCKILPAQTSSGTAEVDQLKSMVTAQQKTLEHQQSQIEALQKALAEQRALFEQALQENREGNPALLSTLYQPGTSGTGTAMQDPEKQAVPSDQQPLTPEQKKVQEELQRGPEIADVTPDTPALKLGPAEIRLLGYPALTGVYRSTNAGGNVGTGFTSVPFDNTVQGNTSEFRLSPQSTRLALRVDADLQTSRAAGYFEMDFGGKNMRRFADPQDLLLHFRQALITAFNRKVATRDHYADSATAHRRQKERGQLLERLACLNFQNNSDVLRSQLLHPRLEIADVGFRSYEGVSEHICIARNKVQSRNVVRGEGGNPKFALR